MSNYRIKWMEQSQTKTGKLKANATLVDETNTEYSDVTIWGDFPGFANLRPEGHVEGTIDSKMVKGTMWKSLRAASFVAFKKPVDPMKAAVKEKNDGIERSQERKADSIKQSSTFRDATILTKVWRDERLAKGVNTTTDEWQTEWVNVRKWLDIKYDEPFN